MANLHNLQLLVHSPITAPTLDTSPETLHMAESHPVVQKDARSTTPSRVKRMSAVVEKTVDILSRSMTVKSGRTSPTTPPPSGHRRLFSLSRKGKAKDVSGEDDNALSPGSNLTPSASRSTSPKPMASSTPTVSHRDDSLFFVSPMPVRPPVKSATPADDSPFVTPPSPPPRPPLTPFRGDGSMRAGTQTLIQALQAIPWTEVDNDEDILSPDSSLSDDDEQGDLRLASSIHTIHRPLARSRRLSTPGSSRDGSTPYYPVAEADPSSDTLDILESDSEPEAEDFEETPRPPDAHPPQLHHRALSEAIGQFGTRQDGTTVHSISRLRPSRAGSMATVRLQRRAGLAEKLKEVFELDAIEEVWAEMPCWLLRSILLQGYMYLTNSYLCFFAHMPSRENQVLKSGSLNKKAQRTKRWIKHWFVLKNDALSWYQSSSDPYFPHGIVDLRYAISCDPLGDKGFRVRTNQKTVHLTADSVPSREEWVKAIRKVIFKAQNMGDSVKIAIPYSLILDVERSSAMDFSETIEVKVFDKEEHFSIDSYFFAYFHDIHAALDQIRDAVRTYRTLPERSSPRMVLDTTVSRQIVTSDRSVSLPPEPIYGKATSGFRLTSLLRPFQDARPSQHSLPETSPESEDFTHISRRPNSSSFVPVTTSPRPLDPESSEPPAAPDGLPSKSLTMAPSYDHTESSSWGVGVPSWLKGSRRVFGSSVANDSTISPASTGVREMYSSTTSSSLPSSRSTMGDLAFSILETPEVAVDADATEKFRSAFAYDGKETLLGYFPGYIYRLLPVFGRLYISTNFFCFKSSGPLTARTRMTLPIRDILALEKSKASRFGHHGLVIIVKGHEELFFEFGAEEKRNAFIALLNQQMDDVRRRLALGESTDTSPGKRDALILEEFDARKSGGGESDPAPAIPESMTDSLPAVMFTSASSTFLTFKPAKSLHFTFLTIGSRGDVQPYIALAKGLITDGHRCKIATHGEFKDWIEAHGIEFGYVGGDPAELMRICVENGTFTVSFLKEGLLKFRGWLDDLLKTSWEACQNTDVLIESPSAMGGYHIAEALGIPYFRAFTMTWSRTRAYPHAFAVPERKMGGSYNYMSYVMFDQVFWRATAGQINRWRRNILHLPSTSLDKMEPHKIPFLYNFSPHVVPPPLDWPEWIRVTGYWFLDDADVSAKKWTPPADLVEFIDTAHKLGKKIVYIGFGSIVVSDPRAMTQCVIEAVIRSGVYAILSKGWSDRLHVKTSDASDPEEPLPKQIYAISSIPHDWLFQRIDAACHHGGAGTTGASLRAGIPTIIRPFFGDQLFWADRVEALGVGTGVRKLTVNSLTEALIAATTDVKQIDRAKLLGEQIRAENGVSTAIESLYRDLEYARSLIKRTNSDDDDDEMDNEHSTVRNQDHSGSHSGYSSSGSARGAPSEDWSVISEQDDRRSSFSSSRDESAKPSPRSRRRSLPSS
ncbi:Sterol 3-beta-glucosyltransferase [Hypsizygus marmoreus]|uniref:Sterol 3-beta-glucosyltransferase n=1 Tax=Hypsizygus marmoreus TaxID=39966 RepID=A0A369K9I1_HYPMA|nr:Sterol 3-beta-glucosyltransferase [Hypsizygus marmoreus]